MAKWIGAAGGMLFAGGGAAMGSMNAAWFDLSRDANGIFPLLGAGGLLVAAGWLGSGWARRLWDAGILGRTAGALVPSGAILFLLNPLLQFAIFGTLAFGIGLALQAIVLWRHQMAAKLDRLLAALAALGSLTWNTETLSAFLLVGVGFVLAALSLRLDSVESADRSPTIG
jgi:hypothetical protein